MRSTDTKPCLYCGKMIPLQFHACPHCGKAFPRRFVDLPDAPDAPAEPSSVHKPNRETWSAPGDKITFCGA